MPDKKPAASSHDGPETQARDGPCRSREEVASYVYDMLASLQAITAAHDLANVSYLIGAARAAAKDSQISNRSRGFYRD